MISTKILLTKLTPGDCRMFRHVSH